MIRFNDTHGPSSYISDSGNTFIQCISLDDILPSLIPTYIKMDIEGAEIEAIKGARNIINEHKPELAISVYHKIEHLWNVPLLLKSIKSNNKLYLRSYTHISQETLFYWCADFPSALSLFMPTFSFPVVPTWSSSEKMRQRLELRLRDRIARKFL